MSSNPEITEIDGLSVGLNEAQAVEGRAVGRQLFHGASLLGIRQFIVQGLGAATGILLARMLEPSQFGLYAISTFFFSLFLAIGDLGLGAGLVRDANEPGQKSYQLAFTVRQIFDLLLLITVCYFATSLAAAYQLTSSDAWLFRTICFAAFLSSFQLVPNVRLERALRFDKLAIVEITQAVVFSALVLMLPLFGFGVMSFGLAWLGYSVSGVLAANLLCPFKPAWTINSHELKARLPFALPYQGVGLLYLARDSVNPLLIGMLLGAAEAGYINFAQMLATFSVLVLMVLQRAYLPAFAKLQSRLPELGELFQKVLKISNLLNAPFSILLLVYAVPLTRIVFGEKWLPAVSLFYFFWAANLAVPSTAPALSLFNALGKSMNSFRFTLYCALATWMLAVPLVLTIGVYGFGIAFAVVQLSSLSLLRSARKEVPFDFAAAFFPFWPAALIMGLVLFGCELVRPAESLVEICARSGAGVLFYAISVYAVVRPDLRNRRRTVLP